MSSVIIASYWWLDSGTYCHRCNFSSLQDQDVVFYNKAGIIERLSVWANFSNKG